MFAWIVKRGETGSIAKTIPPDQAGDTGYINKWFFDEIDDGLKNGANQMWIFWSACTSNRFTYAQISQALDECIDQVPAAIVMRLGSGFTRTLPARKKHILPWGKDSWYCVIERKSCLKGYHIKVPRGEA
jgi:hypothetical protein